MGVIDVILGIKSQNSDGFILPQSNYVEDILKNFNQFDCMSVKTSFHPSIKFVKHAISIYQVDYSGIIDNLIFLMKCITPDTACSRVNGVDIFKNLNTTTECINQILTYVRGTMKYGVYFSGSLTILDEYSVSN